MECTHKVCMRVRETLCTPSDACVYHIRGIYSTMFLKESFEFPTFKASKNKASKRLFVCRCQVGAVQPPQLDHAKLKKKVKRMNGKEKK